MARVLRNSMSSRRILLTGLLALAAVAGNAAHYSLFFGVDLLFGSTAALLALVWLGIVPGLIVAAAGGAYTLLLWAHPYAILIFVAEVAVVAWPLARARRRGHAPPLPLIDAGYWLLLGIPLVLALYHGALGMAWTPTVLIAMKQALNGILNAALASLILLLTAALRRDRASLAIGHLAFSVLLVSVLLPGLLIGVWDNRRFSNEMEERLADRLGLFAVLALEELASVPSSDPGLQASLEKVTRLLDASLLNGADLRIELLQPGERPRDRAMGVMHLHLPDGSETDSRMQSYRDARYAVALRCAPRIGCERIVVSVSAAPLIDRAQRAVLQTMWILAALALIAVLVAFVGSRHLGRLFRHLVDSTSSLPLAVARQGAWRPPPLGLFSETEELSTTLGAIAESLTHGFQALAREQKESSLAMARLRRSETRLANVINGTRLGTWEWNIQTGEIRVNERWAEICGYQLSELKPLSIATWCRLAHRKDFAVSEQLVERHLHGKSDRYECELRMRHKDGHWVWVLDQGSIVARDAEGRPLILAGTHSDISARKRAEAELAASALERERGYAALRESTERYDQLAHQSRTITWEVDADGRFTYVSPVVEPVLGWRPEELIGLRYCHELWGCDLAQACASDGCLLRVPITDLVKTAQHRDGRRVWLLANGQPILDEEGAPKGYRCTEQDITERQEALARLAASERQLRTVFEHAPMGIAIPDQERRFVYVNQAYASLLGRSKAELIGQPIDPMIHEEDRVQIQQYFAELIAGQRSSYRVERRYLRPDGEVVWGDVQVTLLPQEEGRPPLPLAIVEDITKRRAAIHRQRILEDQLICYTLQLEELLDLGAEPLTMDEEIEALLEFGCFNHGARVGLLASLAAEGGFRTLASLDLRDETAAALPDATDALKSDLGNWLKTLGAGPDEARLVRDDQLPAGAIAAGWRACLTLAIDTQSSTTEEGALWLLFWGEQPRVQLERYEQQLLRLLGQRIAEIRHDAHLQHDLVAARERETIGHLASGVAHDFNNLLGVLDGNLAYLRYLQPAADPESEIAEVMDEIQNALDHAKVITSGMLSLSRSGGLPVDTIELQPVCDELAGILRHLLPTSITLKMEIEPALAARSNAAFLQAALLNLGLNARDAMPGGGRLCIAATRGSRAAEARVRLGGSPDPEHIEIRVRDSGCGMSDETLERIFEPLFSTKAKQRGHGLGLFMVKEFVTRTGAALAVESSLGEGSEFRLILPCPSEVIGDRMARPAAAKEEDPLPLGWLKVLLVEDDPRVRESVGRLLSLQGMRFSAVEHGAAALERLNEDPELTLVLSDIAMPVLDGVGLFQTLARERPDLPVILMTGQDMTPDSLDTANGRPPILLKPLDPALLKETIMTAAAV